MGYNTLKITHFEPIEPPENQINRKCSGSNEMISVSSGTRKIERHKMIDDVNSANRGAPIKMHKINSLERRLTNLPSSSSSPL